MLFLLFLSIKGLFVIRWELVKDQEVQTIIEKCKKNHLNTIAIQTFARGESIFKNKFFPRFEELKTNKDILKILIESAHKNNIKVFSWINVFYSWSQAPFPHKAHHLVFSHPEWFIVDKYGEKNIDMSIIELKKRGLPGYFISPYAMDYEKMLHKYLFTLINNYPIDGIIFDYLRYPSSIFGYENPAVESFFKKYYITPKDPLTFILNGNIKLIFSQDRTSQITAFLQKLISDISLPCGVCVMSDSKIAKRFYYQDWETWLSKGIVDFVIPMIYTNDTNNFYRQIKKLPKKAYPSLGAFICNQTNIKKEINILKRNGYHSYFVFSANSLN